MNNNKSINLVNTEEVNIFNDDGSVKETFIFPVTSPIVIMDSSDTETEEEEENDNEKEAQGDHQAAEEVAERKEAEQQQAEQTATPEEATAAVLTRRTQVTAPAWIVEPTPQRAVRLNNNQSMTASLQPAPSIAESESIEALEACLVQELPDLTDADIELMMSDTPF